MINYASAFGGNYESQCPVCLRTGPDSTYRFDEFHVLHCPKCDSSWRSNMYNNTKLQDIYCGDDYEQHPYFDRDRQDEELLAHPRYRHYQAGLMAIENEISIDRLLDVGAGSGTVLRMAQQRGWNVSGVELSPGLGNAVARELNVPIHVCTFESAPLASDEYDAVTFWDIIEHVIDPAACLRKAKEIVRPGGLVLFCTPDEHSWLARIGSLLYSIGYRYPAYALHPPNHTYFFSRKGFRELLSRTNFEIVTEYSQQAYFDHSPLASNLQKLGIGTIESISAILDRQYEMVFIAKARE